MEAPPQVVVAKVVDEPVQKPASLPAPSPTPLGMLADDALQLKAAATCLFCFSLAQLFTLHGFLGCIASSIVVFYAETSPLGTAHGARFTHPLAVATAIFAAGALAATLVVSFAVLPAVPMEEMMQSCKEAQEGRGPWAIKDAMPIMPMHLDGFPDEMHHEGFPGEMAHAHPEAAVMGMDGQNDHPRHAFPVQHFETPEHIFPEHAFPEHVFPEHMPFRAGRTDGLTTERRPMMTMVAEAPQNVDVPVPPPTLVGRGARRLQEMAIDNCDEMVEYMSHYLPMILMLNMMVQAGLLFSACSVVKRAGILLAKARELGVQGL